METKPLDVIIPISLELDWPTRESIVKEIQQQHERYGFTRFALAAPCGGWRSAQYPPTEHFRERAELFRKVSQALAPAGISCGWWITATIKSGPSEDFPRMIRADGTETPFSSCPLSPAFRRRFSSDIKLFARIAHPDFIILEDDYSICASTAGYGCFCPDHLAEFAKRQGKAYTREELTALFASDTPEGYALLQAWRELSRDSLVGLAEAIRQAVDEETPEIPIGTMQSGADDRDGAFAESVSRALAGKRHIPFSRLFGTFYNGGDTKTIPSMLYHPLYSRQHFQPPFRFYHESDTFPHTRFFTSGTQMRLIMGAAYSYGFDGSTFQTQQLLDDANEENAYGAMFARERTRFEAVHQAAAQCRVQGVQIAYDPFWNGMDHRRHTGNPLWTPCVSMFGIPHTTLPSSVAFWDSSQAQFAADEDVMRALSGGLFLDGEAAKCLCQRGYGKYLGVTAGEDAAQPPLCYDLGAREVICDSFAIAGRGRNMPSAHMFANGRNGRMLCLQPTDSRCEVISEEYTFQHQYICPTMTRFENDLGGRVIVMGLTLDGNHSQALFNYRRQRLFHQLLCWCGDEFVFAREEPGIFVIMNEALHPEESRFFGLLTLTNLCEDTVEGLSLHLPPAWRNLREFCLLDERGQWQPLPCSRTEDGLEIHQAFRYSDPVYILGIQ